MAEQRVNILVYRPDGTMIAQYLLGDGEHLIGRDINCPVYLDSEYISSNHAKLYLSHDGIQIEDLNSTSGTYLDGVTVRGKLRIKPGQVLQVGDLTVHLQPESEGKDGPGSRLGDGRYTLVRMLGKGGMGEVWLAKDEQLDEEVALKRLPSEVGADAVALNDMRREVQKSRALSHPNIIRIHDLIQQSGEDPLISLEYVDGTDLTAIAATKTNGIFDWSDIQTWILQLVDALDYAHEEKIVHRDLKPGNIMISRRGRLKLADFGIAATVADATGRSSMEGFISGTTLYMSPQQMEGRAPCVTDDIYAFGATIYELLTSRPPFYTGNVVHQVINVTPTPPSQRLAEFGFMGVIPPYVQELIMACLAKESEGRPQTMGAIRQWIQTEGKATGAIPKPSTKTIKHAAPAAEVSRLDDEAPLAEGKGRSGLPAEVIYVVGVVLIFVCFILGKNCSRGKSGEVDPKSETNRAVKIKNVTKLRERERFGISVGDELIFQFKDHYDLGMYQYVALFSHASNSSEQKQQNIVNMYDGGWGLFEKGKERCYNAYMPFNTWSNVVAETPSFYRTNGWYTAKVLFLDNSMELYINEKLIGVETNLPIEFNAAKNTLKNISLRSLVPGEGHQILRTDLKNILKQVKY